MKKFFNKLVYWLAVPYSLLKVIRQPGMTASARIKAVSFLVLPVIYVLNPFDIIPDVFPLAGWVDDLLVFPLFAYLARRFVPEVDIATVQAQSAAGSRRIVLWSLLIIIGAVLLAVGLIVASIFIGINLLSD